MITHKTIITMIIIHLQINREATDYTQAKIITEHLDHLTQEAEVKDLNTTNSHLLIKDSKGGFTRETETNMAIAAGNKEPRITKDIKTNASLCTMVNFLSSFLPNLQKLLIPIYDFQKKAKKFKWTEEVETAFNEIKKLLINPPVLKAPHTRWIISIRK